MTVETRRAIILRPKKATLSYLASSMLESGQTMNDMFEIMVDFCKSSGKFKVPKKVGFLDKQLAARERKNQRIRALAAR